MISSDWQLEHTGVARVARRAARRLTSWVGSWFRLNGLSSAERVILLLFPVEGGRAPATDVSHDPWRFAADLVVVGYTRCRCRRSVFSPCLGLNLTLG
jgi:hypothetical protein